MKTVMKIKANNEGIYLDVRNYFIYVAQFNPTFRGHRARHKCGSIINERCLE